MVDRSFGNVLRDQNALFGRRTLSAKALGLNSEASHLSALDLAFCA